MKLKYYLRGLGMGILVSTIILMIVYHTQGTMSDADIIDRAKELGMVMEEDDTLFDEDSTPEESSSDEGSSSEEQSSSEEPSSEEPSSEEPSSEEPSSEEQSSSEEPSSEEPSSEEPTTEEPTTTAPSGDVITYTFTVKSGMYSEAVTDMLYEGGIIKNKAEFNQFMEDTGYENYVQRGTYTVNSSMTYEEIAKIVTRRK